MAKIRQVLESIKAKLSEIVVTNGDGNTTTLYVRMWNNQIAKKAEGETYMYPVPACFIELVNPTPYAGIGEQYRAADLGLKLHIEHEFYNADGTFEEDLKLFDLRDSVLEHLTGFKPNGAGHLFATDEDQNFDHTNINDYQIVFLTHFIDDAAAKQYIDSVPPTQLEANFIINQ